jgi:hypothetical protein
VFEGHYEFGSVVPVVERFSLESAGASLDSPLPWPLIHLAFAGLFLLLYTRRIDWRNAAHTVAFAGMTVNLFLLWSRGFSGQFTVYAFPFILLLMPNRRGVGYAGLLAVLWIAEWPGALFVTPEGPQEPNYFLMWLIIARTAILIALCLEYAALLFPRTAAHLPRAAAVILAAGWISVVPMSALLIDTYMRSQLAADPSAPAVDLIRDSGGGPNKTIVFAASRIFRRLYPLARSAGDTLLLPLAKHVPEDVRLAWLDELAARGPFWLIADESDPGSLDENREAEAWVSRYACKVDTQIAGSARVSRFIGPGEMSIDARAVFGDEIALAGARLSAQALQAGDGLCVELDWQALTQPSGDYTVFVHLIDSGGRLMTQNDMPPRGGFAPTGSWPTGSILTDGHGLILPGNLSPGAYTLRVGLYRSDNQAPVPVTQGSQILQDAIGIVLAGVSVIP